MRPKTPKIKRIRQIDPEVEGERAAERERRRLLLARGRASTILSGAGGDRSRPLLGLATLGGY